MILNDSNVSGTNVPESFLGRSTMWFDWADARRPVVLMSASKVM